jgi:hypothetical protein
VNDCRSILNLEVILVLNLSSLSRPTIHSITLRYSKHDPLRSLYNFYILCNLIKCSVVRFRGESQEGINNVRHFSLFHCTTPITTGNKHKYVD